MWFHASLIENFLKGHNGKKGRLKILVSEKEEYSYWRRQERVSDDISESGLEICVETKEIAGESWLFSCLSG